MRYRDWLLDDATRLRSAARDAPRQPVPTCPGWVGRDLVDHVGEVYAHKTAVLRLGRRPAEGEWPWAPDDDTVFAWFDARLAELVDELDSRASTDPAWTFVADNQTVGFWWRRMAHETAIHRVDAELTAGRAPWPHEDEQAVDGVDELVGFAGEQSVLSAPDARCGVAGSVLVSAGDSALLVTMSDAGQLVAPSAHGAAADAAVVGSASDVFRALWNRPTDSAVEWTGDPRVLQRFRARLALGAA